MGDISEMLRSAMTGINRGVANIGKSVYSSAFAQFEGEDFDKLPIGPQMGQVFDENISQERQAYLNSIHRELIDTYDDINSGRITHSDIGHMLQDLAANPNLTDLEKAYVFTEIANHKSVDKTFWVGGGINGDYGVDNEGLRPEHEDSHFFRGNTTEMHTVVGFEDGYHGPLGSAEGDYGVAEEEIKQHEDGPGPNWFGNWLGDNPGDASASQATVDSFRAFREGGFDAFAETWIDEMLVDDWDNPPAPPTGTTSTTSVPTSTTIPESPTTTPPTTAPEGPPTGTTTSTTSTTIPED